MLRPHIDARVRLDDIWASRIVQQMLNALIEDLCLLNQDKFSASLGNPISQHRAHQRLVKSRQATILEDELYTGKRGHFTSSLVRFAAGIDHIFILRQGNIGLGIGQVEHTMDRLAILTHHALVRAVQRGGVRCTEDMITLLRYLWPNIRAVAASDQPQMVPFSGVDGQRVFAVVKKGERYPQVVSTILAEDHIAANGQQELHDVRL